MQIAKNKVVSINYTLRDDSNTVIDTSEGGEPLVYIHGIGNIIPGLEKALSNKKAGDQVKVSISPAEGYGERDEQLTQVIPRSRFEPDADIREGMQFQADSGSGIEVITVTKVDGENITIDANHPLAGVTLNFDVQVVEVRNASEEELSHGHVHGPGGHNH